jgi:hypothetical protein
MPEDDDHKIPLQLLGGEQCPAVYSNVVAVLSTQFDLQIIFGEAAQVTNEAVIGKALVRVVVTPEHAQFLLHVLQVRLDQFIKTVGPLRMNAVNSVSVGKEVAGGLGSLAEPESQPKASV